jgi:hypothetical protein
MYSQTIGTGLWRAPAGSHSRALKRVPSFIVIHSLSTTSTLPLPGNFQPLGVLSLVCANSAVSTAAGIADKSSDERSRSRRERLI